MKTYTLKLIFTSFLMLTSIKVSFGSFAWNQMADFGGGVREFAIAFSVGNFGYAGIGRDTIDRVDFWQYDPSNDTWTQKTDYPGLGRLGLVAFSIGNVGYAGTGWSGVGGPGFQYRDFWMYDPATNTWTQKNDFGGTARYSAVALVIGNKGYVGLGYTPYKSDFWEYDPTTDNWSQKADFPDSRLGSIGFGIGNKGYVGTGYKGSVSYSDFYEYDPLNNSWTPKSDVPGLRRRGAVAFAIGNYGYAGMGYNDTTYLTDFSRYDPVNDQWTTVASIGGVPRYGSFAFVNSNYGYVGGGSYGNIITVIPTSDFWRFEDCDGSSVGILVPPVTQDKINMIVTSDYKKGLVLQYNLLGEENAIFNFYNSLGQLILSLNLSSNSNSMNIPILLSKEIYLYTVTNNFEILKSGKVMVN